MSRTTLPSHLLLRLQKEGKIISQGKTNIPDNSAGKPLVKNTNTRHTQPLPEGSKVEKSSHNIIQWFLAEKPIPKGRPRFSLDWDIIHNAIKTNNIKDIAKAVRITTPQKTKDFEKKIAHISQKAMSECFKAKTYEVHVDFFLKSLLKSDVDNLLKAVMDGMNEIVYDDDRFCIAVSARKHLASLQYPEGIRVRVIPADGVGEQACE